MMQQTNTFGYYQQSGTDGFQAVDLPYAGNNFDMLVILPTTSDMASFESTMNADLFSTVAANLTTSDVYVQLPSFTINQTYDLVPALQDLGIKTAFTGAADFSGISSQGPLSISQVIQKSYINIDETGTEAAAATGVGATAGCVTAGPPPVPISFDANHPFLFAVRDNATNTILFLGTVANPGGSPSPDPTSPVSFPLPDPSHPVLTPIISLPTLVSTPTSTSYPLALRPVSFSTPSTKKRTPPASTTHTTSTQKKTPVVTVQKSETPHTTKTLKKNHPQPLIALTVSAARGSLA